MKRAFTYYENMNKGLKAYLSIEEAKYAVKEAWCGWAFEVEAEKLNQPLPEHKKYIFKDVAPGRSANDWSKHRFYMELTPTDVRGLFFVNCWTDSDDKEWEGGYGVMFLTAADIDKMKAVSDSL